MDLEKQADLIIADHARKDTPPGSISWKFIEQSVAKGVLEDIEDHPVFYAAGEIHRLVLCKDRSQLTLVEQLDLQQGGIPDQLRDAVETRLRESGERRSRRCKSGCH